MAASEESSETKFSRLEIYKKVWRKLLDTKHDSRLCGDAIGIMLKFEGWIYEQVLIEANIEQAYRKIEEVRDANRE